MVNYVIFIGSRDDNNKASSRLAMPAGDCRGCSTCRNFAGGFCTVRLSSRLRFPIYKLRFYFRCQLRELRSKPHNNMAANWIPALWTRLDHLVKAVGYYARLRLIFLQLKMGRGNKLRCLLHKSWRNLKRSALYKTAKVRIYVKSSKYWNRKPFRVIPPRSRTGSARRAPNIRMNTRDKLQHEIDILRKPVYNRYEENHISSLSLSFYFIL